MRAPTWSSSNAYDQDSQRGLRDRHPHGDHRLCVYPHAGGYGEYVDDSVITTKVKSAIMGEPGLKVSEINVETFKGVVQLSGFVSSREDITSAVKVASAVSGVKSVKNDMQLK
jgi:osmotically-inducible protein OsmY